MNPSSVDLCPPSDLVRNQKSDDACTAYDAAEHFGEFYIRAGQPLTFSAKFVYWFERLLSGVSGNVGVAPAMIPTVLKNIGVCLQSSMPDDTPYDVPPSAAAIAEAAQYKIKSSDSYSRLGTWDATLERIKTTLSKGGTVSATMYVYAGFRELSGPWQTHDWNTVPDANTKFDEVHEVQIVGFQDSARRLKGRNSWSPEWADGGFFGIPYDKITDPNKNPFLIFIELTPASVRVENAGWRPDMTATQRAVHQAYIAYFGRPADSDGLDFWTGIASVNPISAVLDWFAASPESQALYGGQSVAQVIAAVYWQLFGRTPDAPGLAFWSNAVASGAVTIGGVIYAILQGAQGTDAVAVAAKVEAASVLTYSDSYTTALIPAARTWLAAILTPDQVQPAVQSLP